MPNAKVFIVEDEAIVAADLTAKLRHAGYEVVGTASRGEEAVAAVFDRRPHVVLMDILLGGDMDGIEAADRITTQANVPVIFLTAHSDRETLARAKVTAPFGYLLKPFNERELETHIEMALYRHQIESALRESEGRLRLAIDATHMALWDWDIVRDRATWAGHYADLFGIDPGTFAGSYQELLALVHPDDREQVRVAMDRALTDHAPYACEFRVVYPDGSLHWLEWWGEVYRDERRQPVRMVGLLQDITRRRQAEDELRRMTGELEQRVAERTEELVRSESRLRALSRELNLTEQRERRKLATDLHDYLAQLLVLSRIKLGQAKRGQLPTASAVLIGETETVLNQALSYTRSLVGQLCPPVLKEFGLIVALKWLAEQMQQHRLTVAVQAEGDHLPLAEDQAVLLFQSVRELLMNVVKHAGTEWTTVTVSRVDGVLRVAVEDNGRGFDAATAPVTAQFGLFSIKERMRALGGRLVLLSSPGKGTTATLVLPLDVLREGPSENVPRAESGHRVERNGFESRHLAGLSQKGPRAESMTSAASHSNLEPRPSVPPSRVLLVDDHAMIREGLRTILEGYPDIDIVGEAANGADAVAMVEAWQPDVVIMDVTMPKMDGIEATRLIKRERPGIIVIGLTVHGAGQVEASMKQAGASEVLTKEAAVDELYQTIRTVSRRQAGMGAGAADAAAPRAAGRVAEEWVE